MNELYSKKKNQQLSHREHIL